MNLLQRTFTSLVNAHAGRTPLPAIEAKLPARLRLALVLSRNPMSIEIIQATEDDRAYLLSLRKLTMVDHLENAGLYLSEDEHQVRLNDAYECSHIIISLGEKVGTLKFREFEDKIEVMQIQIHPDNQGRGFGTEVIKKVLGRSKFKAVELTVLKANPAKQLYERLGFLITGEDEYEFHMEFKH